MILPEIYCYIKCEDRGGDTCPLPTISERVSEHFLAFPFLTEDAAFYGMTAEGWEASNQAAEQARRRIADRITLIQGCVELHQIMDSMR